MLIPFALHAVAVPQSPAQLLAELRGSDATRHAAAAAALEALGTAALPALRAARGETADPAAQDRVEHVLGGIELAYPGGLMLAFTRGEAKATELWLWRDGVELPLTANQLMEAEPALSPDGTRLAFTRTADHHDFGVRELATGTETVLAKGRSPRWSPDGGQLAVARESAITLHDLASGKQRQLGGAGAEVTAASWSPNGRFLAGESGAGIVVFDVGTGAVHARLDGTPPGTSSLSSFSLGDSLVSMVSGNGPYHWDVFVVAIDGGEPRKLTAATFQHGMTSLSPDGSRMLSLQNTMVREGSAAFVLQVTDGAQREVFANVSPLLRPTWSPEGKLAVFVDGDEMLQLLHVQSGRTRSLTKMQVGHGPAGMWFAPSAWFARGRAMPAALPTQSK